MANQQVALNPVDWGVYGGGNASQNAPLTSTSVELFVFQDALNQPATPVGGAYIFSSGSFTPPSGWLATPPANPAYNVWISNAFVSSNQPTISWNTPGRVAVNSGAGSGTVTQVLGTAGDISSTPATPNSANYTIDLVTVPRNDTVGTTTNMAVTAVNTDTKGRLTGVQISPILGNQGTVTQVTGTAGDLVFTPNTPNATTYNGLLSAVTRTDTTGSSSTSAITALSTDSKGRVLGVTISPIASGTGTVSNVSVISPLSSALQFLNQTTTPQLQIVNATAPTTQYLGGDGNWTIPRGMGTIIGVDNVNFPGTTVQLTDSVGATFTDAGSLFTVGTGNVIYNQPWLWSVENIKPFKRINFSGMGVTTSVDAMGSLNVAITGGGGGGGSFSAVTARWTNANSATKNAYSAQPTVNNDGISINLTASSNPGAITTATISLNGTALPTPYTIGGTFPNYTITIPVGNLTGNAAETDAVVTVLITIGTQFSLSANNLINVQPVAFTTALTVNYVQTSVPYFNQVADIAWSYSNSAQITSFGGNVLINGITYNFTAPSGTLSLRPSVGGTIGGSASGFGLNGAPSATINFSGNLPAVPTFVPAFYTGAVSSGATPPTFTTANSFTNGDPIGKTITFTQATATTQYIWVATTYPSTRIYLITALGNATVTPNVVGPQQTISGQAMNVFGYTGLAVSAPVQFIFV